MPAQTAAPHTPSPHAYLARLLPRVPGRLRGVLGEIDTLVSQSRVVETPYGRRVVKDYSRPMGVAKWVLGLLPPASIHYPYETSALGRLLREERFYTRPPRGVRVPRVYEVDYRRTVMVKEYIEGTPLSVPGEREAGVLGDALGRIHSQDYCLGDTKPSNFLKTREGQVAVIDAEQALTGCGDEEYKDWDTVLLMVFLYYADPLTPPARYGDALSSLLDAYMRHRDFGRRSLERVHSLLLLLPPNYAGVVKRLLA